MITNVIAVAWRAQQQPHPSGVPTMNGDEWQGDKNPISDREKRNTATRDLWVQSQVHLANVPPLPYPFPIVVNHGQKRRGGERPAPGAVRAAPLLLPHGRPAVRGERAGGEGRSPHGAAVRRRRRWSGATTARRGVPMRPSAMDLDVAPATTSAARRWPDRSTPDGAAAQRPSCLLLLQRARAQGSGGGGAGGEGRRWARCAGGGATWTVEAA